MRINEILQPSLLHETKETGPRKISASGRFLKHVNDFRSMPGFLASLKSFIDHFSTAASSQQFRPSDIVQDTVSRQQSVNPMLRTSHMVHGKAIVAYQLFPGELRLIDVGSVKDVLDNLANIASYTTKLDADSFRAYEVPAPKIKPEKTKKASKSSSVPVTAEPAQASVPYRTKLSLFGPRNFETLSSAELDQLSDMIEFIAAEGDAGKLTLLKVLDNNWREFLVWCRIALGLKGNDTSRDLVIRRSIDTTIKDRIRNILGTS